MKYRSVLARPLVAALLAFSAPGAILPSIASAVTLPGVPPGLPPGVPPTPPGMPPVAPPLIPPVTSPATAVPADASRPDIPTRFPVATGNATDQAVIDALTDCTTKGCTITTDNKGGFYVDWPGHRRWNIKDGKVAVIDTSTGTSYTYDNNNGTTPDEKFAAAMQTDWNAKVDAKITTVAASDTVGNQPLRLRSASTDFQFRTVFSLRKR